MATDERVMTREDLFQRASDLLPVLRERAPEAERLRQIPPETIADLRAAGLLAIGNPKRYGGYDCDIDVMFEVAMELGRACGSTAWCFAVWSIHNWMVGHWPQEAHDEYFAEGPQVLSSSGFAPSGDLIPADGGYHLTGRWQFSSGSDAATWVFLGARTPDGARMAMLPRADYEVIDTWFVAGMKGTGSKDIEVRDAFVPAHRVSDIPTRMETPTSAYELHGRPSYLLPPSSLMNFPLSSPLVGVAQGALDAFIAQFEGKSGPGRTADSVGLQLRIAESSAEIDAARLLTTSITRRLIENAACGVLPDAKEQATVRRDVAYIPQLAVRATNRLFEAAGGHALFDSSAIQRFHRDVNAGSHQRALDWDAVAEAYGREALGLPPLPPTR
jgi:3-hydroxy-9,10-secoandrosta-1,3,5(10)-triene-9,17-dione monooxygenase